jgi:hypothetical protein
MSARTARRRRKQAVQNYNHLARLGRRGKGTSRPIYAHSSVAVLEHREALFRERRSAMQSRMALRKRKS